MATRYLDLSPAELHSRYGDGERNFQRTRVRGALHEGLSLHSAITSESDWRGVIFKGNSLAYTTNRGTNFYGTRGKADFTGADNQQARFDRSYLREAKFRGSDNTGASFKNARYVQTVDWTDAIVRGMDVRGLNWEAVDTILTAADIDWRGASKQVKKQVYRIVFRYLSGDPSQVREAIRFAVDEETCPFSSHENHPPLFEYASEMWPSYRVVVRPKSEVTETDLRKVQRALVKVDRLVWNG